jgi:mevalonate pyrophosphate decarboxylase
MTREQYITTLKLELNKLNQEIDHKIINGQSYSGESRKHKVLLAKIRQHAKNSFLGSLFLRFNF